MIDHEDPKQAFLSIRYANPELLRVWTGSPFRADGVTLRTGPPEQLHAYDLKPLLRAIANGEHDPPELDPDAIEPMHALRNRVELAMRVLSHALESDQPPVRAAALREGAPLVHGAHSMGWFRDQWTRIVKSLCIEIKDPERLRKILGSFGVERIDTGSIIPYLFDPPPCDDDAEAELMAALSTLRPPPPPPTKPEVDKDSRPFFEESGQGAFGW